MRIRQNLVVFSCLLISFSPYAYSQQQKNIARVAKPKVVSEKTTTESSTKEKSKVPLTSPEQLKISENYGSIKEVWEPGAGAVDKMIIHIQDAHCNYEAQSNICKIIDDLMTEYPDQVKLVAVEGSVGLIDTSPFAEFSDKEIKKEVADYFMKKGKITGPEFLSITGDHKFTIYGIETKELYDRNYKAFLDSLPFRDESGKYCEHLNDILNQLKEKIYSSDLKEFDKELMSYQKGDTGFLEYVDMLSKWSEKEKIQLENYKNFVLLKKAQAIEKSINFNTVEKERAALIDKLNSVLGKEELSELVMKSLNFRTGKMTAAEYYNYLKKVVEKYSNSVSTAEYPNLFAYIDYVNVHYTMDKNLLFDECAEVEGKIADALCKNELQKRLFTLSKHVGIYERMFKLELVKDDYRYYKAHKQDFKIQTFLDFIKVQAPANGITFTEDPGLSKIDSNLPIIEEFYEVAILRDPVLINNTIEEMNKEGATVCVMTTGGFHTKGLTEILKEKNVAYAVISPKITKQPEYNPYIDVMTNKKTPFEEFLDQLGSEEE